MKAPHQNSSTQDCVLATYTFAVPFLSFARAKFANQPHHRWLSTLHRKREWTHGCRLASIIVPALLTLCLLIPSPARAQFANQAANWEAKYWWRNCASLDMDFVHDQYYINGNTTCDGTIGTQYTAGSGNTGVVNFINGTGATFTRAGATNVTDTNPPFYLDTTQGESFVSRASVTNDVTPTGAPFFITTTGNGPSQLFVSRGSVGTYFDSTGTLQTQPAGAGATAARSAAYYYNGSSWVLGGTLIEPAATNSIRNNTMVGAVASSSTQLVTDGSFTSCSGSTCTGWTTTLNGGTGTVSFSPGTATLTGDGTNAASIYQKITTVSGYIYTFAVTVGSGNAVTLQAGTAAGGSTLLAVSNAPANATTYYQFLASSTSSYVQINNTSTTSATITTVSVVSAGKAPTDWALTASTSSIVASVVGTGTINGINYIDVNISGTATNTTGINIAEETPTGIGAAIGQVWTLSGYLEVVGGSTSNVNLIELAATEQSSAGGVQAHSTSNLISAIPTSGDLANYQATLTMTLSNANTTSIRPYIAIIPVNGGTVNITLRIGMPQMEQGSTPTSVISTSSAAVTRSADIYNQQPASYFDSSGTLYFSSANTARTNYVYSGGSWVGGGTLNSPATTNMLIEPAATNSVPNNTMQGAVAADGVERTTDGNFASCGSGSSTCTGWTVTTAGSATVIFNPGSATLTGDGANAASIYQAVKVTPGFTYNFAVTTGSGSGVTVQAGANPGGEGWFGPTIMSANTTNYFSFTPATQTTAYIQINNTSASSATVTNVSFQSAGEFPTSWKAVINDPGLSLAVYAVGVQNGISYTDWLINGTPGSSPQNSIAFLTTGASASPGQTWTASLFITGISGTSALSYAALRIAANGTLATHNTTGINFATPLDEQDITASLTMPATTTAVSSSFIFTVPSSTIANAIVRLGMPQLEQSSYATSVIPTFGSAVTRTADVYSEPSGGTYYNSAGVLKMAPANTPRLDYGPTGGNYPLGVLIEESRTNSLEYSSNYQSPWGLSGATATNNAATAPDSTTSAILLQEDTSTGPHYINQSVTGSANTAYTYSLFMKNYSSDRSVELYMYDSTDGNFAYTTVNPVTGGTTGNLGTVTTQQLTNGWYRISVTGTPTVATFGVYAKLVSGSNYSYTGNGTSGAYIWGAQLEAGAYPTSYIPTSGSAVTRAVDSFTLPSTAGPGSGWYAGPPGTLHCIAEAPFVAASSSDQGLCGIDDGTSSNSVSLKINNPSADPDLLIFSGGTQVIQQNASSTPCAAYGICDIIAPFQNGAQSVSGNGLAAVDTSLATLPTVNRLNIGHTRGTSGALDGWVNRVTYFPIRHPDASLPGFSNY